MSDKDLTELQHELGKRLFGTGALPLIYYDVLRSSLKGCDASYGEFGSGHDPRAYWLTGGILGFLTCKGENEEQSEIRGSLHRLTDAVVADITVVKEYDGMEREVRWWGRMVTLQFSVGESITIDATRGYGEAQRRAGEQFLDKVLAKIALGGAVAIG